MKDQFISERQVISLPPALAARGNEENSSYLNTTVCNSCIKSDILLKVAFSIFEKQDIYD